MTEPDFSRPRPPAILFSEPREIHLPSEELEDWLRRAFIDPNSRFYNVEHDHLQSATIGACWTNTPIILQGQRKAACAEMPNVQGSRLVRSRYFGLLESWFGVVPDFLLTFCAYYGKEAEDRAFCCVGDHELKHCGQKHKDGIPQFDKKTGQPKYAMRPHDSEVFVSDVERWGIGAAPGRTAEVVAAARRPPLFADVDIAALCGTAVSVR